MKNDVLIWRKRRACVCILRTRCKNAAAKFTAMFAALFLCAFVFVFAGCGSYVRYSEAAAAQTECIFLVDGNENDSASKNNSSFAKNENENEDENTHIPCPKHAILHLTHEEFLSSVSNPRVFPNMPSGKILAGVVPHHNVAAALISGFFSQAAKYDYDLVIILASNHSNDFANVISSYRNWDIGEGVYTNRKFVNDLLLAEEINSVISHSHMESDHSVSILIPFIYHYLPGVEVAPVLLNRSLSFSETEMLFRRLKNWITESEKSILLVASIDFSHFLPVYLSREKDRITKDAILRSDFRKIHNMSDHFIDSPAALIIFLMYLEELGLSPEIVAHTDASEFLGPWIDETTSYMIIVGACAAENENTRVQ